ncbi:MAG TPA: 3-oxoacyl-ACP reductase [Solirubrobacteraceae bacterium]
MKDRYLELTSSPPGRLLTRRLGAPQPARLRRHRPGDPILDGPALLGAAPGGRLGDAVKGVLKSAGVKVLTKPPKDEDGRVAAVVYDATGIGTSEGLRALYDFLHPVVKRIGASGRLLVLGTPPEQAGPVGEAVAQRALEGFVRSVAKELRQGATAQLVYVAPQAENAMESTLRFLLSGRSAYVDAQVLRVNEAAVTVPDDWDRPLSGPVAVVTGASRGIGESVACTLARDGATVVCLDVPAQGEELAAVANKVGGTALQLDITDDDAPQRLAEHLREYHQGVDAVIHNAGVTRDRTLARMSEDEWSVLIDINLSAPERLTAALLDGDVIRPGGRIVCMSSMTGIAGQRGQANYGASKAGLIGFTQLLAPRLTDGRTINAVAPGFIETQMTSAMPLLVREAGRRMNTLAQGGHPVDVAETVAWLSQPASGGVNGNVVRVCGQSLLGA